MAESPVREADAPADPRRIRQARRDGGARRSRRSCRRSRRARRTTGWASRSGWSARKSADRARHREPLLADVLRHRHGEDGRGLRRAGRMAVASRTARLAGHRIRPHRLGREGDAEADRDERDLPAVVESHAGAGGARSGEPAARARTALPPARGDDPRPGALRRRAADGETRRAFGEAVSAGRPLERAGDAGHGLRPEQRRRISIAAACTPSGSAPSRRP